MLKRIILVFLFIFICQLSVATPALAASAYPLNTNSDVPQNFHTYTQSVFIEIAAAISCQLTGYDPTNPGGKCLGIDPKTKRIGYVEGGGGAIGMVGSFIAQTFYIPISTHDYGEYMAGNFGLTKKAYAAGEEGVGFNGLLPLLPLWQTFRNLTYLIFVVVFVLIGLGIMFRIKIDPRTVMSIQNQIPKIIIGLLLVTFSYAIAGFLIDLMYVSIFLIISTFREAGVDSINPLASTPFSAVGGLGVNITTSNIHMGGISGIAEGTAQAISGIVVTIFDGTLGKVIGTIVGVIIGKLLPHPESGIPVFGSAIGAVETIAGGALGFAFHNQIIGLISGVIAYLIIIIALFSALLRLWFALIKAYIFLLLTIVLGPFYIAYGILPGKSGIGNWIKSILANLAVFPATIAMLLLGQAFVNGFAGGVANRPPFVPPLVGSFSNPEAFASIIGLGVILLTPEVVNMVRDALKAPEFKYSTSIGRSVGVGTGVITAGPRQAWSGLMRQPRWMGDPGGPLYTALSDLQNRNPNTWGKLLAVLNFHGHASSNH